MPRALVEFHGYLTVTRAAVVFSGEPMADPAIDLNTVQPRSVCWSRGALFECALIKLDMLSATPLTLIARFAVQPRCPHDMHRAWTGSAQALADICALHHQRQLSAQGACKFEGSILQLLPGQPHAPKARAMVDITQHADGTLRLSYYGRSLAHRRFALEDAVPNRHPADHKTVDATVDKVLDVHRKKLHRLAAEMAFQDSQRKAGIYTPDAPPIVTRRQPGSSKPRSAQRASTSS